MIMDDVVLQRLSDKNAFNDAGLIMRLEEKLNMERYLDAPPTPVKLEGQKYIEVTGVAEEFKAFYNRTYDTSKASEVAKIDLSEMGANYGVKQCDYCVWVTLKTLIMLGVTKNAERANACRKWFMRILGINSNYISKGQMYMTIESREEDAADYFSEKICETIVDCTCNEDEQLRFHIMLELYHIPNWKDDFQILYDKYKGSTPWEFDKATKELAKTARKDEYFFFDRKEPTLQVCARYLAESGVTTRQLIDKYVHNSEHADAMYRMYGDLTPKAAVLAVHQEYLKTRKGKAKPEKTFPYVGEMICTKLKI